jgi:hypothetical protein
MFILLQFATLPCRICHRSFRSPFAATSCAPPTMASNPMSPSVVVVVADDVPAPPGDDGRGGGPSDDNDGAAQPPDIPPAATSLSLTSLLAAHLRDIAQCPLLLSSPLLVVDIVIIIVPSLTSLFIAPSSLSSLSNVVVGATLKGCIDGGAGAGASSPPSAVVDAILAWGGSRCTLRRSQL